MGTSWAPQADKPTWGQAQEGPPGQPQEGIGNRGATSKGGREKERGYFLGIPNLLGSGYEFQGWHFSKERERLAESHKGVQNAPQAAALIWSDETRTACVSTRGPRGHTFGSRTPAGQHVTARPISLR